MSVCVYVCCSFFIPTTCSFNQDNCEICYALKPFEQNVAFGVYNFNFIQLSWKRSPFISLRMLHSLGVLLMFLTVNLYYFQGPLSFQRVQCCFPAMQLLADWLNMHRMFLVPQVFTPLPGKLTPFLSWQCTNLF